MRGSIERAPRGPLNADVRQHLIRIALAGFLHLGCSGNAQSQEDQKRETADYNFDGHLDYRLPSETPGNQCGWWKYFIFDAATKQYRSVDTPFCKEEFDPVDKLVKTRVNGGMAGYIYAIRHFRWEGFELVPVFVETQNYDQARDLFIRTKLTNFDSLAGPTTSSDLLTREEVMRELEGQR